MLHFNRKSFKYCLDLYVVRDKNCIGFCCSSPHNLLPKIQIAKACGYTGVELWHKDIMSYKSIGSVAQLREQIEGLGLKIPSYKVVEHWGNEEVLKTASELGAKSCVVKLFRDEDRGDRPEFQTMRDNYLRLLDRGSELGVVPSLEFMALAKHYNSIDDVCELLDSVDHPYAGLVLDTWHLWRNDDKDFSKCPFSRINPKWISVVHFTDARKDQPRHTQTDGSRKMPGEGLLNLSRFARELKNIGFGGWLSLNVYDQSLWHEEPSRVACRGKYAMESVCEWQGDLMDSNQWRNLQEVRCSSLWSKSYWSHLDPRVNNTNRRDKLLGIVGDSLKGTVLDFKCGFSPLADFVSYGFDAYFDCIQYLRKNYPKAEWYCDSDESFSSYFDKKLDVLLHIGLGDSKTEYASHLLLRKNCRPHTVIIEAAADSSGQVDESKSGNRDAWEKLKKGLVGQTFLYETDMEHRSKRIVFVGKNDAAQ